jgi:2-aminoadipate transaminase
MLDPTSLARRAASLSPAGAAFEPPGTISFGSGDAFPGLLPDMVAAAGRALSAHRTETLQYAPRLGLPDCRAWVARLLAREGVLVPPEEVMIVNGAKNGLDLLCRLLLDEGDAIVVTAPTYFTALPMFRTYRVDFIEVPQDGEGMDVAALADALAHRRRAGLKPPKFVYDVPDFHNPTGVTMSGPRRAALVDLAVREGMWLIEDSPYRSIRFSGESPAPLKAFGSDGGVFALGTVAKLLAPGLRIGWIVGPREMLARMAQLKSDGGTSPLAQRLILEFCAAGGLEAQVERARATYRRHRDVMSAALRREIPDARFVEPEGGYYVWLTLPPGEDGDAVAAAALAEGVSVLAGSKFFARAGNSGNAAAPGNHIRLAYSFAGPEEIEEGVKRLARALARRRRY